MNNNTFIVYDMETTSVDKRTCQVVQIAAVAVHPRKLCIIENSEFDCVVQPEDFSSISEDNIYFHCKAQNISKQQLIDRWKNGLSEKLAWKNFVDYLDKYYKVGKKTIFNAPLRVGFNNLNYDDFIVQRLSEKYGNIDNYGQCNLFFPRDFIDVMNMIFWFFENDSEVKSYSLDNMRTYFSMPKKGGHDALFDVKQTAELLIRFLKLCRTIRVKFKGAFNEAS